MIGAGLRMLVVGAGIAGLGALPRPAPRGRWTVLLGRGVTFLAVPIGRGQADCYCDAPADSPFRPEGDNEVTGRLAELLAGFAAPVPATRNLPPALRNLILRRWGRGIFHANYRPPLELS